jgi:uracil phosphoribosyltransferase
MCVFMQINDQCAHMVARECRRQQLRIANVLRASMDAVEPMFETLPNLRVIHLVRDPRAVVAARLAASSATAGIEGRAMYVENVSEACNNSQPISM